MAPADRDSVVDRTFRQESGRAVAALIRVLRDFDAAEEAVQEAFVAALERWPRDGIPANPGAWITQVARNKAIDRVRRERTLRDKETVLKRLEALRAPMAGPAEALAARGEIEDDRLRLVFTACHPALAPEARVALTLRTLGGLSTAEIARAFLVAEATMAQRLVRAKAKIAKAGIPYEVPDAERMLCAEAIRLARVTLTMLPREPELRGLLALMLLNDARRPARVDAGGEAVPLERQDRTRWDPDRIAEGQALSEEAAAAGPVGPYTVQARIAAAHASAASAEETDWARIVRLYEWLAVVAPSPVVELNRAAAVAMLEGPERGLELIDAIEGIDDYQPLHAARADLLRRLGRDGEAAAAYERALALSENPTERRYIESRIAALAS